MKVKSKVTYLVLIFSLLVIISLVFSMKFSHNALESENGVITINDVVPINEHEYVTYRVFDYTEEDGGYTCYIPNESSFWYGFATDENYGAKYVELIEKDGSYLVSWKQNIVGNEILAYEFAKSALAYIKENYNAEDTTTNKYSESTRTGDLVTITNLPMGYYVVDTANEENGAALCILSEVSTSATIQEKIEEVMVTKELVSIIGPNGENRGTKTASVGDIVSYRIYATVHRPYNNWVIHDELKIGLAPNFDSYIPNNDRLSKASNVPIKVFKDGAFSGLEFTSDNANHLGCISDDKIHSNKYGNAFCTGGYKVTINEDNTHHIEFHICEHVIEEIGKRGSASIVIEYSARVSENAGIDENGNSTVLSKAWVTYGSDKKTNEVFSSPIQTYNFDLVKTDNRNNILQGAKFNIYQTSNNKLIEFMKKEDKSGNIVYCPVNRKIQGGNNYFPADNVITDITLGNANIRGLAAGSYYLVETEAPTIENEDGSIAKYNKLSSKVNLEIVPDTEKSVVNGEEVDVLKETSKIKIGRITSALNNIKAEFDSDGKYVKGGVQIVNLLGAELPNTGSIGTIVLYVVGGIFVIFAIVILVVRHNKKNKNSIQE